MASTAGFRWKFRRRSLTTRQAQLLKSSGFTFGPSGPTSSSRFPALPKAFPIEESIFVGVPVNVTLLFSREQYLAAADAYLRGIERRIDAALNPDVASVGSVFVSRWDAAIASKVPDQLRSRLGIAIALRIYKASNDLIGSPRCRRALNSGARP